MYLLMIDDMMMIRISYFVSPGKRKSDAGVMVLGRAEGIWNPEESFFFFFVQPQQQKHRRNKSFKTLPTQP
jgi:hypothetical protein